MWEYNYSTDDELIHYGVKGMKWGVRRYQDSSGRLTAEGRKRARKEYKEDNKMAYNLGREATIYDHATAKLTKRTVKFENKLSKELDKDPTATKGRTKRMLKKDEINQRALMNVAVDAKNKREEAQRHAQSLIDKYGSEAVTPIKYKTVNLPKGKYGSPEKITVTNERTNKFSDYARAGAATLTSLAFSGIVNAPVAVAFHPSSTSDKANMVASVALAEERRKAKG